MARRKKNGFVCEKTSSGETSESESVWLLHLESRPILVTLGLKQVCETCIIGTYCV